MNKKSKILMYSTFGAMIGLLLALFIGILRYENITSNYKNIWFMLSIFLFLGLLITFSIAMHLIIRQSIENDELFKKSFSSYLEHTINYGFMGVIIYNSEQKIIWCSNFIKNRFGREWIGKSLTSFFDTNGIDITQELNNKLEFNFKNSHYLVNILPDGNSLSISDTTEKYNAIQTYDNELSVIGELEIDNYQLYQSILTEEQLFKVVKETITILDKLVNQYNLIYRRYTNGKFIIFTNCETLKKLEETKFSFIKSMHNVLIETDIKCSFSIGFAQGWKLLNEKMNFAKTALLQSQNRGGDQVTILSAQFPTKYYGSTSEILPDVNRNKVKTFTERFKRTLLSNEIEKVIVYGHQYADLDALGSAYGIYSIVSKYNKPVYICSSTQDATTKNAIAKIVADADSCIIRAQNASKLTNSKTMVVLVDNALPERTDYPQCIVNVPPENIFIIDHHRQGKILDFCSKQNAYIDPNSSSASEIITEMMMFLESNFYVSSLTAQMLLNGIYLDTLQFQKKVSYRTFEAAAWLQNKGAITTIASEIMKMDDKTHEIVLELLNNLQEIKDGYFLAYKDMVVSNDIISMASDEVLRISGRRASFVVAREATTNKLKLSARGLNTNVQIICESVGGGGHYSAAAAVTDESIEEFISNIKQAIVSVKDESDIN